MLLSPYLASGVISARACIRGTMELLNAKKVEGGRDSGVGMWVQEVGTFWFSSQNLHIPDVTDDVSITSLERFL